MTKTYQGQGVILMDPNSLNHFGILGMKWGVRRFQNEDGTLTQEGKERYSVKNPVENHRVFTNKPKAHYEVKPTNKMSLSDKAKVAKIGAGVIAGLSVAAAAVYVAKNPGKVAKAKKAMEILKKKMPTIANMVKEGAKEGIKQGIKEGPKTLAKTVVKGSFVVLGKKAVDQLLGKALSDALFKANDKDKIGKFWTGLNDNKNDDEEDD